MIGSIVTQLTRGEGAKSFDRYGNGSYYIDHANGVYPASAAGVPFTAAYLQSKADPIADIMEDMAAEQKARATYDNILRISDDPDVNNVIRFLREREIVHFQRFGDTILTELRGFGGVGEGADGEKCRANERNNCGKILIFPGNRVIMGYIGSKERGR